MPHSPYLVGRVAQAGNLNFFFIETDGETDLHARVSNGRKLGPRGEFTDSSELEHPQVGDLVCYEVTRNSRGTTAFPWAFLKKGSN